MRDVFTYGDKKYAAGDLTLREVERIEKIVNTKYLFLEPQSNMGHKIAYMSVFLLRDHPIEEVERIISTTKLAQIEAMWALEDDDLPDMYANGIPSPVGGRSTLTS
jgi:hypothetical protein